MLLMDEPELYARKALRSSPGQLSMFTGLEHTGTAADWKEDLHPRDDDGKFRPKGVAKAGVGPTVEESPTGVRKKTVKSSPGQIPLPLGDDEIAEAKRVIQQMRGEAGPRATGDDKPFSLSSGKPSPVKPSGNTVQKPLFGEKPAAPMPAPPTGKAQQKPLFGEEKPATPDVAAKTTDAATAQGAGKKPWEGWSPEDMAIRPMGTHNPLWYDGHKTSSGMTMHVEAKPDGTYQAWKSFDATPDAKMHVSAGKDAEMTMNNIWRGGVGVGPGTPQMEELIRRGMEKGNPAAPAAEPPKHPPADPEFSLSTKPKHTPAKIEGSGKARQVDLFAGRGDSPGQTSFFDDIDPAAKNVGAMEKKRADPDIDALAKSAVDANENVWTHAKSAGHNPIKDWTPEQRQAYSDAVTRHREAAQPAKPEPSEGRAKAMAAQKQRDEAGTNVKHSPAMQAAIAQTLERLGPKAPAAAPLKATLFHGRTGALDTNIDLDRPDDDDNSFGPGLYLSHDRERAAGYGPDVHEVGVDIHPDNLLDLEGPASPEQFDRINAAAKKLGLPEMTVGRSDSTNRNRWKNLARTVGSQAAANKVLKEAGFHAIANGKWETVVLDPKAISGGQKPARSAALDDKIASSTGLIAKIGKQMGVKPQDMDDFISDVQLKAIKGQGGYDPEKGEFSTWLATVARNHKMTQQTRQKAGKRAGVTQSLATPLEGGKGSLADTVAAKPEKREIGDALDVEKVREAMGSLPDKQREAFMAVMTGGKSVTEAAAEMGISKQAVSAYVNLAKAKIKAAVGAEEEAEPAKEPPKTATAPQTLAEKVAAQRAAGKKATPPKAKPKPKTMVSMSGGSFELVKENDDGTVTVKNDQGDEFTSDPGEDYQIEGRAKSPAQPVAPVAKQEAATPSPPAKPVPSAEPPPEPEPQNPSPDDTPREAAAKASKKQIDEDYAFARKSEVPNAGEDLLGSARHKRNAWKGLADAEANGTADEMVTRENLLKHEPHDLVTAAEKNPLTALAMHYALRKFPAKPGYGNERALSRRTDEQKAKDRRQFHEAFQSIKAKADELAHAHADPIAAMKAMQGHVLGIIHKNREGGDRYNNTSNALASLYNNLHANGRGPLTVAGQMKAFSEAARAKYGDDVKAVYESAGSHAQDIIEGKSLNHTFGRESGGKGRPEFNPADLYVKTATRKGGRVIDANTVKASTGFLMNNLGMRGIQHGNSVTDDERQHHLQKTSEAFADMADVLGLEDGDMSLGGKLGLAFGARGHGTASAHYEPMSKVINLTRKSGVGTLAHEWGHFFDHALADFKISRGANKADAEYMSEMTREHEFRKDEKGDWIKDENGKVKTFETATGPLPKAYKELREAWSSSGYKARLSKYVNEQVRSKMMSQAKAKYWTSGREVFARCFEQYIQHKLRDSDRENTYLSGLDAGHPLWPSAEEVKAMAPAFDAIFAAYKAREKK